MRSNITIVLSILSLLLTSIGYINVSDAKLDESTIAGMWTFEDGRGDTVTDESGNGSDGTFVGDLKWVDGKFGGGLEFNGENTWVKIGTKGNADSLAALDFSQSEGFSIHAWVYSAVAPTGKCIVWKGLGCSSWSQYLLGTGAHENNEHSANASFHIRSANGGDRLEVLGDPLPEKDWVHVVGVWDSEKLYLYVNGDLQNSVDASGAPWTSSEEVYLGADPGCSVRCQWNGIMDEVVIFNVALSESEVRSLGSGIEGALAVDASGKTTTTWGTIKSKRN